LLLFRPLRPHHIAKYGYLHLFLCSAVSFYIISGSIIVISFLRQSFFLNLGFPKGIFSIRFLWLIARLEILAYVMRDSVMLHNTIKWVRKIRDLYQVMAGPVLCPLQNLMKMYNGFYCIFKVYIIQILHHIYIYTDNM
jgi:hypothetical protein